MDESDGQTALFLKLHTDTFDVSSCPVGMVSLSPQSPGLQQDVTEPVGLGGDPGP